MAVFAAWVYRIRSTPYFLLFSVLFGLQVNVQQANIQLLMPTKS